MWRYANQPVKNKVLFGDYASEYLRNLSVSKQKHRQKPPYSWEVDRQIFPSPRYGEVDRQICLSYSRMADLPSPLLSLYYIQRFGIYDVLKIGRKRMTDWISESQRCLLNSPGYTRPVNYANVFTVVSTYFQLGLVSRVGDTSLEDPAQVTQSCLAHFTVLTLKHLDTLAL